MESISQPKSSGDNCPFASIDEGEILISSNVTNLKNHMKINTISPAANTTRGNIEDSARMMDWFSPDSADDMRKAMSIRWNAYNANPDTVLKIGNQKTKSAVFAAASTLLNLQTQYLVERFPEQYKILRTENDELIINVATGHAFNLDTEKSRVHPLAVSGLLGQEDICLVQKNPRGQHIFRAGFLATPTMWRLSQFVDRSMDYVHHNVPDYGQRLKRVVDDALEELTPDELMVRNNVFIFANPSLAIPLGPQPKIDQKKITDPGTQIFIRSEHETLRRLPESDQYPDSSVFTIQPRVYTLKQILENGRADKFILALQKNKKLNKKKILAEKAIDYLKSSSL